MNAGLNSNIKRDGKIFHIQTEDSGHKYGHIISHLFLDGAIYASTKLEYKELMETQEGDELEEAILKLMCKSHRKMIAKLTSGGFDENYHSAAPNGSTETADAGDGQVEKPPVSPPVEILDNDLEEEIEIEEETWSGEAGLASPVEVAAIIRESMQMKEDGHSVEAHLTRLLNQSDSRFD